MGHKLNGITMDLSWDSVFAWSKGQVIYVVHVGSEVGSANLVTGKYKGQFIYALQSCRLSSGICQSGDR